MEILIIIGIVIAISMFFAFRSRGNSLDDEFTKTQRLTEELERLRSQMGFDD
jgi:hypothetical protein